MNSIQSITKGLQLSKSLLVSSIIIGEPYTGKMTLVKSIYPQSFYVDANNLQELESALENYDEIIIYNFEAIINIKNLDFQNKRVIAIANKTRDLKSIEEHFAFIYHMPSLKDRTEDVAELTHELSNEIQRDLMIEQDVTIDPKSLDLSQNFKSFKVSLYKQLIKKSLTPQDIEDVLYDFFLKNLDGKNEYRDHISIYEKPLITAGLKKYKSQLQLADVLGLNRNTLRKKINELNLD
jgi:DNA-binding NtrC family response regulator